MAVSLDTSLLVQISIAESKNEGSDSSSVYQEDTTICRKYMDLAEKIEMEIGTTKKESISV